MQLIANTTKELGFYYVSLIFLVNMLETNRKGVTIVSAFESILNSSKRKPSKIWVDQGSKFYNSSFEKWLEDNDIKMYSTHNEVKFVAAERFIRNFKNKIYKHMTAVSKNVYFDVLNDIVDRYNNTYYITIKSD